MRFAHTRMFFGIDQYCRSEVPAPNGAVRLLLKFRFENSTQTNNLKIKRTAPYGV
jgi:hypothetical protein